MSISVDVSNDGARLAVSLKSRDDALAAGLLLEHDCLAETSSEDGIGAAIALDEELRMAS